MLSEEYDISKGLASVFFPGNSEPSPGHEDAPRIVWGQPVRHVLSEDRAEGRLLGRAQWYSSFAAGRSQMVAQLSGESCALRTEEGFPANFWFEITWVLAWDV